MPKKAKKKKSGGKSKVKGKGSSKKGAKVSEKDDVLKEAITNALLWENRLSTVQNAKNEYRESTRTLLRENEKLLGQVALAEKDTIDVISFLKEEDAKKDKQITYLQTVIKDLKKEHRDEKLKLVTEYSNEIETLQKTLSEKNNELKLMQAELKLVKEFRRKRGQMQKELDELRDKFFYTEKKHQGDIEKVERKFFDEKIRLQQEASTKISELAETAHKEAVNALNETTKTVYMENVRLNEALSYHVQVAEELLESKKKLEKENKSLNGEKEMNALIVEDKILLAKKLEKQLDESKNKIKQLESTVANITNETSIKRKQAQAGYERGLEVSKMAITRLEKTLELKSKEMNRVKKLAKSILDQRSELETFFMNSLEHVKNEIVRNRSQYCRDAESAYNQRMLAAHTGTTEFPRIRTFRNLKHSTNSVFTDIKEAENWSYVNTKVDISDLTWEQKERVIRMLFGKLNDKKKNSQNVTPKALPPITASSYQENSPKTSIKETFITQSHSDIQEGSNTALVVT